MTTPNEGAEMTNLMDFADEYAKQVADAPVTNNIPQRQFAISQISAARDALSDAIAACDARHRQELAAYELTVSNLRAELEKLGTPATGVEPVAFTGGMTAAEQSIELDASFAAHGIKGEESCE